MPEEPEVYADANEEALFNYVQAEKLAGTEKFIVIKNLMDQGWDNATASAVVEEVYSPKPKEPTQPETPSFNPVLVYPVLAGLGASIVGGVIWGVIVITTHFEIGYMAVGIGALSGYAVHFASGHKRSRELQIIAIVSALLGIFVSKYFLYYEWASARAEKLGQAGAGLFSSETVGGFFDHLLELVDFFDILWVFLAISAAWRMLDPRKGSHH